MNLPGHALFEHLGVHFLEACPRKAADKVTTIRKHLKADIGRWQAEAVMSCYTEACLRQQGKCGRYLLDATGATLRLREPRAEHFHFDYFQHESNMMARAPNALRTQPGYG